MKLYNSALSGNVYKVRLMLSLLGLEYEVVPVNLAAGEQKSPQFLAMNPLGQVPVLEDGGTVVRDSQAILVYLARRQGAESWLPNDAVGLAHVVQWLSFSSREMLEGPALARAIVKFKRPLDLGAAQASAKRALGILEARLAQADWLALDRPTVADVACYPYAALVEEGEVPLAPYPALRAWFGRMQGLPGWVGMEGLYRS